MTASTQPSLTIVAVTGHDDYSTGSMYAIERSFQQLRPHIRDLRCLLVSPTPPHHLPAHIRHIPTAPFGYLEYNLFVLYALEQLIETDFCLVVQQDGFVLDGKNWRNDYFNYDYIGAPIPQFAKVRNNKIVELESNSQYLSPCQDNEQLFIPQNGGFSLRSKRLLSAPRRLGLDMPIHAPNYFRNLPIKLTWHRYTHNEDLLISTAFRTSLEADGLNFAPLEIAVNFSTEDGVMHRIMNISNESLLGCHLFVGMRLISIDELYIDKIQRFSVQEIMSSLIVQKVLNTGIKISMPRELLNAEVQNDSIPEAAYK